MSAALHGPPLAARASRGERARIASMVLAVVALHVVGWGLAVRHAAEHPGLLGAALLAWTLGLRHAFDADHLAAIDNTTRRLRDHGERPVAVGFFFAVGHAAVVVAMVVVLALIAATRPEADETLNVVGKTIAGVFLVGIGALNLHALVRLLRVARRAGRAEADEDEIRRLAGAQGVMGRLGAGRLARRIVRSWHMLPLGALFGLGFETATEVAVLGIGTGAAVSGLPLSGVVSIPLVFAAGLVAVDTADGLLMGRAYDWALAHPLRRLSYNVVITLLSVALALLVAAMNLLPLAGVDAEWVDSQTLGFVATGLLLLCWAAALALWRVLRIEERWTPPPPATTTREIPCWCS